MDKTFVWHDLFRRKHVISRLNDGPFQPYLDSFATALDEQRYGRNTIRRAICAADHFGRWLLEQNLAWTDAHGTTVSRYYNLLGRCEAGDWPHRLNGLHLVIGFLDRAGITHRSKAIISPTPVEQWLCEFDLHMERVVGAAKSTRQRYRPILSRFLGNRFGSEEPDWSQLAANDLTMFIQQEAAKSEGFGRKVPGVALRSFLRFLVSKGLVRDGLGAAIPSPRQYLYATLPARATEEQVRKVLVCCLNGTPIGMRDHAVLLLLVRLGLRAREVARLTLDELDWHRGVVRVAAGKTRRERVVPLPDEVGTSLAAYLQLARPDSADRAVFLHAHPPHRPWSGAAAVSQLVHRRLLQSGFPARPWRGAHLFRHTVASQMVNAGASFKDVADLLGHQSLATTGIYAKLNLDTLASVAMPWSGGKL